MENEKHPYTNRLINETSPYLLQHAHNPVDWHPWGPETLEKARKENKLIIVSIGYSACHWCHVMEHESFMDTEVAAYMNEHFVPIKVDREERPDIDQVYMNAVQLQTGRAGWPLNCITLPDGRPLFGGTYFPKEQWMEVLRQVRNFAIENPEKAEETADQITHGIRSQESVYIAETADSYSKADLENIFERWSGYLDFELGGTRGAPKFPLPVGYRYLLFHHYLTNDNRALEATETTLQHMASGGIYDQVGGGFARYSVDADWKVPHFEKMLYDNAQLISLYAEAFKATGNTFYREVFDETISFLKRELRSNEGGFYAALDADSEGEEGKFYVWTAKELKDCLGKDYDLMRDYFRSTEEGNWEDGKNILMRAPELQVLEAKYKVDNPKLQQIIQQSKVKLLEYRSKRIRPGLDDKILTAWNALMISGLTDAFKATEESAYLEDALTAADFLNEKMMTADGGLSRNYKNGNASINGFLDDYAFTISAWINLYQATFKEEWLNRAKDLTEFVIENFFNTSSGMFYYTSAKDPELIARKMEITDNVIPAASSEMAKNLFLLGNYFDIGDYKQKAKQMLDNVREHAMDGAMYYANWDILMAWLAETPVEVAIVGSEADRMRARFNKEYLPDLILLGGAVKGALPLIKDKGIDQKTMIYVCRQKTCKKPVETFKEAIQQIRE